MALTNSTASGPGSTLGFKNSWWSHNAWSASWAISRICFWSDKCHIRSKSISCKSTRVSQATGIPCWRSNWHNTRSGWWSSTMWKHIKGDTLSCPAKQYLGSPCNDIAWNVAARPPMYIWNTISISQFQNKTAVIIWYTSILTWSRVCVSSLWVPSLLRIYLTTYKQCMFMRTQLWTKYTTLNNDTGGIMSQQTTLVIKIKGKK